MLLQMTMKHGGASMPAFAHRLERLLVVPVALSFFFGLGIGEMNAT